MSEVSPATRSREGARRQAARAPLAPGAPRAVSAWLFTISALLLVMIALGGATRLTGSGLSIMDWRPVTGIIPPLTHAEWERQFALYRTIPQYRILHDGFGLAGFQRIFWLEWIHRFSGRLIGLELFVPMVWFALRGALSVRLIARLVAFLVLGGLQGAIGWFMVASGFDPNSTAVQPVRLVLHLSFAFALAAAIFWTAMDVRWAAPAPVPRTAALLRTRALAAVTGVLVALTVVAGGFTAGTHAGFIDNSFPLMGGRLVPEHYAHLQPFWRNLTQNLVAVQFDHRLLATLTVLVVLATLAVGLRAAPPPAVRRPLLLLAGAVVIQYCLGITTLLLVVPVWAGTLHQTFAAVLLGCVLLLLHTLRGLRARPG